MTARGKAPVALSFILGVAVASGIWLAGPAEGPLRTAAPSASTHALEANLTDEQKTAIADLVVGGKVTGAAHGLVADDPHGFDYQDMPWNGKQAIDWGQKQTKVTFSVESWLKGSSPVEIYLLVYHNPDGSGAPQFVTQELIDAVLDGKRLRIWGFEVELHPSDGTHWSWADAVVID